MLKRRTVLALEDGDLALSSYDEVAAAVRDCARDPDIALPDHVFWVDAFAPPYLAQEITGVT